MEADIQANLGMTAAATTAIIMIGWIGRIRVPLLPAQPREGNAVNPTKYD